MIYKMKIDYNNMENMNTGIKVGDVMTRDFVHATPDTDLLRCARTMMKKRVHSLILTDNNVMKGIITSHDILWVITKKPDIDLSKIPAKTIATKRIAIVKPSVDIFEAIRKMSKTNFRRLPVIEGGKVVGLITVKDVLKIQPSLCEALVANMKIKEETDKIRRAKEIGTSRPRGEGVCEECGNTGWLYKVDGRMICEDCMM